MALLASLAFGGVTFGGTPDGWWQSICHPLMQPRPCCPDDYCLKPLPRDPCPVCQKGPNDYCPKPLAISLPLKYKGVNDYCPKCCPILLPSCYPPWYICGPAK